MNSKFLQYLIHSLLFFTLIFNLYFFISPTTQDPPFTLSAGDRYYSRLNLWFTYAKNQDWSAADTIEPDLDPADISDYKSTHHVTDIKKTINQIIVKPAKTVEDWLELAKLQTKIGDKQSALESLTQARQLDPIRDDINQFYFQLSHN